MEGEAKSVFVTVGTTRFDALIETLDSQVCLRALRDKGFTRILMQIGHGEHEPQSSVDTVPGLKIDFYRYNPQYKDDMAKADLVISHAGAGSIMDALSMQKSLLVVVNTALMDNHQVELAEAMAEMQYCLQTDCKGLPDMLQKMDLSSLQLYPQPDEAAFPRLVDAVMNVNRN